MPGDALSRATVYTLCVIAIGLLFVATRVVSAQDLGAGAGASVPATRSPAARPQSAAGEQIATDDATVLALAMAMVAEGGWDGAADHAAIAHTIQRKADRHRLSFVDVLVRYVAIFRVSSPRQRWVTSLNLEATKPDGWPVNLAWSAHVERWQAVVARARAFVAGTLPDPCGADVEHWGGVQAGDTSRGRMQVAACSGFTRNTFFTVRR